MSYRYRSLIVDGPHKGLTLVSAPRGTIKLRNPCLGEAVQRSPATVYRSEALDYKGDVFHLFITGVRPPEAELRKLVEIHKDELLAPLPAERRR